MPISPQERIGSRTRKYIGTEEHFRWLEQIVRWTLVLNAIDAVLTLLWIHSGLASEGNPMMATLIDTHPVLFVVVKCSLVTLGSLLLWRFRKRPLAVIGIFSAFLLYYCLLLYHLNAADLRLLRRWLG